MAITSAKPHAVTEPASGRAADIADDADVFRRQSAFQQQLAQLRLDRFLPDGPGEHILSPPRPDPTLERTLRPPTDAGSLLETRKIVPPDQFTGVGNVAKSFAVGVAVNPAAWLVRFADHVLLKDKGNMFVNRMAQLVKDSAMVSYDAGGPRIQADKFFSRVEDPSSPSYGEYKSDGGGVYLQWKLGNLVKDQSGILKLLGERFPGLAKAIEGMTNDPALGAQASNASIRVSFRVNDDLSIAGWNAGVTYLNQVGISGGLRANRDSKGGFPLQAGDQFNRSPSDGAPYKVGQPWTLGTFMSFAITDKGELRKSGGVYLDRDFAQGLPSRHDPKKTDPFAGYMEFSFINSQVKRRDDNTGLMQQKVDGKTVYGYEQDVGGKKVFVEMDEGGLAVARAFYGADAEKKAAVSKAPVLDRALVEKTLTSGLPAEAREAARRIKEQDITVAEQAINILTLGAATRAALREGGKGPFSGIAIGLQLNEMTEKDVGEQVRAFIGGRHYEPDRLGGWLKQMPGRLPDKLGVDDTHMITGLIDEAILQGAVTPYKAYATWSGVLRDTAAGKKTSDPRVGQLAQELVHSQAWPHTGSSEILSFMHKTVGTIEWAHQSLLKSPAFGSGAPKDAADMANAVERIHAALTASIARGDAGAQDRYDAFYGALANRDGVTFAEGGEGPGIAAWRAANKKLVDGAIRQDKPMPDIDKYKHLIDLTAATQEFRPDSIAADDVFKAFPSGNVSAGQLETLKRQGRLLDDVTLVEANRAALALKATEADQIGGLTGLNKAQFTTFIQEAAAIGYKLIRNDISRDEARKQLIKLAPEVFETPKNSNGGS